MRLSKIARYSASLEFLVALFFPDLCVRNKMIVFAALLADSIPLVYKRISYPVSISLVILAD